jgi:hypothetical protein
METSSLLSKIQEWEASQKGQTSAYDYEKTFDQMWQELGKEVLQESLGEIPSDKNKKNFKE